jgi:hypothetical protein
MNIGPKQPGQMTVFQGGAELPAVRSPQPHPGPSRSVSRPRPWLVQIDHELRLVESEHQLSTLVRQGRVTSATPVYEVAASPQPLGEVPELAHLVPEPPVSEPPIRQDQRSRERALFSEELAVLNRPLEDDVEYYDDPPARRWPKRLAVVVVLAVAGVAGYPRVASRMGGIRALATTRTVAVGGALQKTESPAESERSTAPAAPPPIASTERRGAGEVTPRSSEHAEPRPGAVAGAAGTESNTAGRHNPSHRMKVRSSRARVTSRH